MPNWCQNSVYIEAPSADIQAIIDGVTKGAVLNSLYPEPEHVKDTDDHMPAWWRWRTQNWGTKWDAAAEIISYDVEGGWINLAMDTAWSPPIEAFEYWAEQNEARSYTIRYIEYGMGFTGQAKYGERISFYIEDIEKKLNSNDLYEAAIAQELDNEFEILTSLECMKEA